MISARGDAELRESFRKVEAIGNRSSIDRPVVAIEPFPRERRRRWSFRSPRARRSIPDRSRPTVPIRDEISATGSSATREESLDDEIGVDVPVELGAKLEEEVELVDRRVD